MPETRRRSVLADRRRRPPRPRPDSATTAAALREARRRKQLTQQALARRLGLRQRQISDLERAKTDSRLSTIQDVARALDLELMLVPRQLISAIEALQRAGSPAGTHPVYALGEETDDAVGEPSDAEIGRAGEIRTPATRRTRPRRGARR